MKSTVLLASIGMLGAVLSSPLLAGAPDDGRDRDLPRVANARPAGTLDHGMQAVPNSAGPNQWGHGWQYFSEPTARRAVVISPQGDYYHSRGKGPRWVAAAQTGVREGASAPSPGGTKSLLQSRKTIQPSQN